MVLNNRTRCKTHPRVSVIFLAQLCCGINHPKTPEAKHSKYVFWLMTLWVGMQLGALSQSQLFSLGSLTWAAGGLAWHQLVEGSISLDWLHSNSCAFSPFSMLAGACSHREEKNSQNGSGNTQVLGAFLWNRYTLLLQYCMQPYSKTQTFAATNRTF